MSLTRGHQRMLMAMYLRVDADLLDPEKWQVYPSAELPVARANRLDIALEAEGGGLRILSVAEGYPQLLRNDGYDSLVSMRARASRDLGAEVRYGEIYVLDREPRRAPLPSPYRRGMGREPLHDKLAAAVSDPLEVQIAWKDRVIAGGTIHRYDGTPFATSMVHIAPEHRGRGLGAYIAVVTAQRIKALGMYPITMVSDKESESRWTLRWIGYERAIGIGALSVAKGSPGSSE